MTGALVAVTVIGFGVLVLGFVLRATGTGKRRLDHGEATAVGKRPLGTRQKGTWWFRGRAEGVEFSDEMSFGEMKRAVRDGTWRGDPRVQQFILMTAGAVVGMVGLTLLIGWLIGPAATWVAAGIALYVVVQMVRGFRRAT